MICAMEVAKFTSFPSIMPFTPNMTGDLNNQYYSLFGSYPSNYYGHSTGESSFKKVSDEMVDESENKENSGETNAQNVNPLLTIASAKCHENVLPLTETISSQNYSIFPPSSLPFPSSFASFCDVKNYCSFLPLSEQPKEKRLQFMEGEEEQQKDDCFETDGTASSSFNFSSFSNVVEEQKNESELDKLQKFYPRNRIPLSPKQYRRRLPPPGWDEKLIQRIESFRSLRHIQERISSFRKQYKKGFRYRSKQRAPLRVQLLRYNCLNSIYGDLECIVDVKKALGQSK